MKTTDLFDFRFVDRVDERKKFNSFLKNLRGDVLWIRGNRGIGKTKFVECVLTNQNAYKSCITNIQPSDTSVEAVTNLILSLQACFEVDFITAVCKKYKKFYNKTGRIFKEILPEVFPEISGIVTAILNTSNYVINFSEQYKNPLDIINDYISSILATRSLFFCIDNYSRCDLKTAQIFNQIIKSFIHHTNFRACIITTSEDLKEDIREEIFYSLPFIDMELHRFSAYDYFYQILEPQFDLSQFSNEDLKYIWCKCDGSPKKLSTLISKLLEKQGVTLHKNKKAWINKRILFEVLQTEHVKFKDDDFNSIQKWIIFSYLCLEGNVHIEYLADLSLYISRKCILYRAFNEEKFNTELLHLLERKILCFDVNNIIRHCHDEDYIELMDIFNGSQLKGMFSQFAYEFLLQNPIEKNNLKLICDNAREANISGWEKLCFNYGKKLFRLKQFYDAQKIFIYLNNQFHKLTPVQIITIAISSYETGNFDLAIKQFEFLPLEILRYNKLIYYYHYYLGKSYNNIGKSENAIDELEKALKYVNNDSTEYVQALNILHMFYLEIPHKKEIACDIFRHIKNNYKETHPTIWANTMRGCQNFIQGQEALDILDEAEGLVTDELERAYIENTRGFLLIKIGEISMAEDSFSKACTKIKDLKLHEYSYAANNLAVCRMMRRDFLNAYEILLKAFLWNRTNYGNLVLQTHLMVCCSYLDMKKETEYYYNYLKQYMEEHSPADTVINRKIYMNLAIISGRMQFPLIQDAYYKKVQEYAENTDSEIRYKILTADNAIFNSEPTIYQKFTDFEPWFLIYAHD